MSDNDESSVSPRLHSLQLPWEFDGKPDHWIEFLDNVKEFFKLAQITTEDRQRSILLLSLLPETKKLARRLLSPTIPREAAVADIKKVLTDYYKPKTPEIATTFKFRQVVQKPGQSVPEFMADLNQCNFEK